MPKFRVAFRERTDAQGQKSEDPTEFVDFDLEDGVVLDRVFLESAEPLAQHVQGVLDEDDAFESVTAEVWEYDVADGREQDFINALKNSRVVMEYERIDDIEMINPATSAPSRS